MGGEEQDGAGVDREGTEYSNGEIGGGEWIGREGNRINVGVYIPRVRTFSNCVGTLGIVRLRLIVMEEQKESGLDEMETEPKWE